MKKAYGPLKNSADAAQSTASAALMANATTRAQINGTLIIPDEPDSKIQIGQNGAISLDLNLAVIGQSWAREVYVNIGVSIQNGPRLVYNGPSAFTAGFDVSPTNPWHHTIDDFLPVMVGQIKSSDVLDVETIIAVSYLNIFDEWVPICSACEHGEKRLETARVAPSKNWRAASNFNDAST
jgi:hypothetical protein